MMQTHAVLLTISLAVAVSAATVDARQHEGHQGTSAASQPTGQVAQCVRAQSVVAEVVQAALKRLEDARLTNSAAAMRDATDDLQAALLDIKTQLLPCSQLQVATANTMPGHIMPPGIDSATPVSPVSSGGGADPHAAHVIQAAPSGGATAVPEAAKGAVTARPLTPAATAEAAPVSAGPPTNIADLKCRTETDQKTAPRMLYQGRMYYFCSEQERAEFAKNPGRYVTSAPEAAPAHAH